MIKVNGEEMNIAGKNLKVFLEESGYVNGRIAVEMNGEIVPRATYEEVIIKDGDVIEVVSFVGGG